MAKLLLNVNAIQDRSTVNGPGVRSVVWVQGCTIGCPGCFNPHTHTHEKRHLFDPELLGRQLASIPSIGGLTLSGGEPFEQAGACALLAETVRAADRSVMVFTGYPYELLRSSGQPDIQRLLRAVDLLVAGPYVQALKTDGTMWQASRNQSVHVLTDRLADAVRRHPAGSPTVEIIADGRVQASTGFPGPEDNTWLAQLATCRQTRAP
ncbi:MAG: radical SAM protein [Sedimentisphaerales bacterium]|nr:radical SAM protein [Sedimentisphaerales bacterium]